MRSQLVCVCVCVCVCVIPHISHYNVTCESVGVFIFTSNTVCRVSYLNESELVVSSQQMLKYLSVLLIPFCGTTQNRWEISSQLEKISPIIDDGAMNGRTRRNTKR